jgi:hypothetical protein
MLALGSSDARSAALAPKGKAPRATDAAQTEANAKANAEAKAKPRHSSKAKRRSGSKPQRFVPTAERPMLLEIFCRGPFLLGTSHASIHAKKSAALAGDWGANLAPGECGFEERRWYADELAFIHFDAPAPPHPALVVCALDSDCAVRIGLTGEYQETDRQGGQRYYFKGSGVAAVWKHGIAADVDL